MYNKSTYGRKDILVTILKLFLTTFLFLALIPPKVESVEQELILFTKNGNYMGFKTHISDISGHKFGDAPFMRICIRGIWVVYETINYQDFLFGLPFSPRLRCWNHDLKKLKSFRYLGGPNTEEEGISFYENFNFEGNETLIDAKKLEDVTTKWNKTVSSFAISGGESYTFFSEKDFKGEFVCFKSPNETVHAYPDTEVYPQLKTIRSVKQGCSKGAKEHEPPSK